MNDKATGMQVVGRGATEQNIYPTMIGGHCGHDWGVFTTAYAGQQFTTVVPFEPPMNSVKSARPAPKRVLVVDDDDYIADLLVEVLSEQGLETSVAYDGFEGLERAIQQQPDLIITDIMMPGLSGLQLVETLRHRPDTLGIPVLLTSAGAPPSVQFANTVFMRKPFDLNDILDCVERLLVHA